MILLSSFRRGKALGSLGVSALFLAACASKGPASEAAPDASPVEPGVSPDRPAGMDSLPPRAVPAGPALNGHGGGR